MSKNNPTADGNRDIVLQTRSLTRLYGSAVGIRELSLEIRQCEIFGFLGPNGSGKTTTINLLLGLISPDSGSIAIFHKDPRKEGQKIRSRIGFLPSNPGYYEQMKGIEYLRFFGGIRGAYDEKRILELAESFFNVDLNRKISTYSEGMKQIVGIIQAFAPSPDLYILDEPTNNLDPLMKRRFYQLVEDEVKKGKTVFLSSHILAEVERLCHRVGIVRGGTLVALDSVRSLREKMKKTFEVTFTGDFMPDSLRDIEGVAGVQAADGRYFIETTGTVKPLLGSLAAMPVDTFDCHTMTLEEVFWEYFEK